MRSRVFVGTGTARTAFSKLLGIAGSVRGAAVRPLLGAASLTDGFGGAFGDEILFFILVIIPIIWFNYQNSRFFANTNKYGLYQTKKRGNPRLYWSLVVRAYQSFHHGLVARAPVETIALLGKLVCRTRREASARSFMPNFS